ncbi:FecR family protein [Sphingomonas sp. CJ20]
MVSRRNRAIDAEAAAWVARLSAPDRNTATDAALKGWLHADAAHRDAFERATEIWAILPGAALYCADAERSRPAARLRSRRAIPQSTRGRFAAAAIAASLLLAVSLGVRTYVFDRPVEYATRIGEQKVTTLSDGTRIALNTDSEVEVAYHPDERRVRLERGEAMFEVAPNPARPFIVSAGDKQVRAVGTSFIVRRTAQGVVVTLIQGKVAITDTGARRASPLPPTILAPGERLTATEDAPSVVDQPSIESATAWRRGQAVFNDLPLAQAVAEINRYGGPRVTVDDPRVAALRVSGVFATNDTAEFAAAIAALHGLRVERGGQSLKIVR